MSDGPVLFWDIDGTLLSTARAGILAWEDALHEVSGAFHSLQDFPSAGLTDLEIANVVLRAVGMEPDRSVVTNLLRRYEAFLPACLPLRQGHLLPGVRETLDYLTQQGVPCLLLTGNTAPAARIKLTHYGLASYFAHGAFAEDGEDRPAIARHAQALAQSLYGVTSPKRMFVIGDTPHDIACGRAIGARTIAVATGPYTMEELQQFDPWRLLPQLSPPSMLVAHLSAG